MPDDDASQPTLGGIARDPGDPVWDGIAEWASLVAAAEGEAPPTPRTVGEGAAVELREIGRDTVRAVCRLVVAPPQRRFVAPNAVSLAEALFDEHAWCRLIAADGVPVGFVMLYVDRQKADYGLWRLMIADGLQGRGYGLRALEQIVAHVRTLPGATRLVVSWVPGPGSPAAFYLRFGFEPTGEVDEGEIVAALRL